MLKLPAYFTGYSSKTDGSFGLRFSTQELPPDTVADMAKDLNGFGWLVFAPQQNEIEIPKDFLEDDRKSPSERLYSVLYVWWKQQNVDQPFDVWRLRYMDRLIENIKSKLTS